MSVGFNFVETTFLGRCVHVATFVCQRTFHILCKQLTKLLLAQMTANFTDFFYYVI